MTIKLIMLAVAIWIGLTALATLAWALLLFWIRGAERVYILFSYPGTGGLGHLGRDRDPCLIDPEPGGNDDRIDDKKDI